MTLHLDSKKIKIMNGKDNNDILMQSGCINIISYEFALHAAVTVIVNA